MSSHLTEDKLVAYILNEVDDSERALVEKELHSDPAARLVVAELRQVAELSSEALSEGASLSLTEVQRSRIRDCARNKARIKELSPSGPEKKRLSWLRRRWTLSGLAAACAVMVLVVALIAKEYLPREKYASRTGESILGQSTHSVDVGGPVRIRPDYAFNGAWGGNGPIQNGETRATDGDKVSAFVELGSYDTWGAEPRGSGGGGYGDAYGAQTRKCNTGTTSYGRAEGEAKGQQPPPPATDYDQDRYLIKNAGLQIEVDDVVQASSQASAAVASAGGYVSSSDETADPYGNRHVTLQLRVPADAFDATMATIEILGRVINKHVGTEDVTDQYVDVDAHIRNLKVTEERLLDHLRKTSTMENTLKIEKEITRVREELERNQGQLRVLAHRVRFSTIDLGLAETPKAGPAMPVETFSSGKVASEATRSLMEHLRNLWTKAIWLGVWSPVWGMATLVVWLVYRRLRRRWSRRNQAASVND